MLASSQKVAISKRAIATKPARAQTVRVCAVKDSESVGFKMMAAGLAAAALIATAPAADAKVILVQPEVKNLVTGFEPKAAPASSGGSTSTKARKLPPAAEVSGKTDIKPLVLPLSIVAIAGGALAVKTLDPGFDEVSSEWGAKDSRGYAGYETSLKDTPFYGGSGSIPGSARAGAAPKKGKKK